MIYQLFVEGALVAKGCKTLAEAMAYADEEICKKSSCRIVAIGHGATLPTPTQEWRYDYKVQDWVQS
ncbi:hypothetical protein [Leisingera caerulea]|uniref:hypothetical protein n=1 Tax=Leisingera caerulea TaxID=506591 RepID=UPI000488576C|nr:hypothetical protein [Leisingera caerulea]